MTIDPEDYLEPRCPLEEPCGCRHEHHHGSGPEPFGEQFLG